MIPNGGTFVRPGVIAWDGFLAARASPAHTAAYSSCEAVEQAVAAALADAGRVAQLLTELARARLWLPLPDGPQPVTNGSAVVLPVITCAGTDFVPAFTSVQRLTTWADPRTMRSDPASTAGPVRSGDPPWVRDLVAGTGAIRHVVVPLPGLASRLPAGLGIAINPGTGVSLRVCPDAVSCLAESAASAPSAGSDVEA
jgi:hypothetical protein